MQLASLKRDIVEYRDILKSHQRKLDIIVTELEEIKERYTDERKTEISLSDDLVIEDADLIIVMDDGHIDSIGTHEQLLKSCKIYQEVYYSQNRIGGNK